MESAIIQVKDKADLKLLAELAKRMGFSMKVLTAEDKEDMGMAALLHEADRTKKVSKETIVGKLKRWK